MNARKKHDNNATRREAFLKALRNEKLETIRWSLNHGGLEVRTRDDDGRTSLMITAFLGKHRALDSLLYKVERTREREVLDLVDEDGMTALMMACAKGHLNCVEQLYEAKANVHLKSHKGWTARDYAQRHKHDEVVFFLDHPEGVTDEEGEVDGIELLDGETTTQAHKRKKRELQEQERFYKAAAEAKVAEAAEGAAAAAAATADAEGEEPALSGPVEVDGHEVDAGVKELPGPITRLASVQEDATLWRLKSLNRLSVHVTAPAGGDEAASPLTALPARLGRLGALTELTLANNALATLPDELGALVKLKVLDVQGNALTALPGAAVMGQLKALEFLTLNGNQLASLEPLDGLVNFVSVRADRNALVSLAGLDFPALKRLTLLSAASNAITELPENLGEASKLEELVLGHNQVKEVPCSVADLKKLKVLSFEGCPLADPKIHKHLEQGKIKDCLKHIGKQTGGGGGGGGGGGKKGKGKKK